MRPPKGFRLRLICSIVVSLLLGLILGLVVSEWGLSLGGATSISGATAASGLVTVLMAIGFGIVIFSINELRRAIKPCKCKTNDKKTCDNQEDT